MLIDARLYRRDHVIKGVWLRLPLPPWPEFVTKLEAVFGKDAVLGVLGGRGIPDVQDVKDLRVIHAVDAVTEMFGFSECLAYRDAFGAFPASVDEFARAFLGHQESRRVARAKFPGVRQVLRYAPDPSGGVFVFKGRLA
jgi:hypothetical protein